MNIKVLFGTETGNSEDLANKTASALKNAGNEAQALDMENVNVSDIAQAEAVVVITSTWGDGEPPSNAMSLYEELSNTEADLSNLKFAVFAIGSSGFEQFCKAGKDFDEFLAKANAKRVLDIELCDDDFDDKFAPWSEKLLEALKA